MPVRHTILTVLAGAHLAAVLCGACGCLPHSDRAPLAQLVRWYAAISGAQSRYGFFAPAVGALHRAKFILRDANGRTWSDTFDQASSPEARLRLTGIVDVAFMSGEAYDKPQWRARLVESWSATMFSRHPEAVALTVVVEAYDIPTMAEYRSGSRPQWEVVYRAEVRQHDRSGNERRPP